MNTLFCEQWHLSRYAKWDAGEWKGVTSDPTKQLVLSLQDIQLLVVHGEVCLESVSVAQSNQDLQGIYNNGTLVIICRYQGKGRKFRILFSSPMDGEACVVRLRRYFKITVTEGSRPAVDKSVESLSNLITRVLGKKQQNIPCPESIPREYPLEAGIKLCILDPAFPTLVQRVDGIITTQLAIPTPPQQVTSSTN